jgi:hypothetical protein
VLQQIICTIKIRRAPTRHDSIDFRPIITRTSEILPLSVVTGDKGYDSEENHVLVRELLHAFSVIPARYEHVPIWRTHGKYGKQMKRGYSKLLYNQNICHKKIIWRTHYFKVGKNTESRIIIQMYSLQYPQVN